MSALATITNINSTIPAFRQMTAHTDMKHRVAWCYMHADPRPCFTPELLDDLNAWCGYLRDQGSALGLHYHVIASSVPGIFNLGGDLSLFQQYAE